MAGSRSPETEFAASGHCKPWSVRAGVRRYRRLQGVRGAASVLQMGGACPLEPLHRAIGMEGSMGLHAEDGCRSCWLLQVGTCLGDVIMHRLFVSTHMEQ